VFRGGGTASGSGLAGRPAAGKTGTTDNRADANFLGFTPQLATFVWHGNAEARVPGAGFGGQIPARIWKRYMDAAHDGLPVAQFPAPGPVCARPGAAITENGRVAGNANGLFPGDTVPSTVPPTVIINSTTTLPPITLPTTTTTTP
jgi:penicillin-binding protein 1A